MESLLMAGRRQMDGPRVTTYVEALMGLLLLPVVAHRIGRGLIAGHLWATSPVFCDPRPPLLSPSLWPLTIPLLHSAWVPTAFC